MDNVVIVEGLRTPYAKAWTAFNHIPAYDLGRIVTRELLEHTALEPEQLDEVIWGNVGQPVEAINISRIIALKSGIPDAVPAYTVQRNCGSGLQALVNAVYQIRQGDAEIILAGGVESMSNFPLLYPKDYADWLMKFQRAKTLLQKINLFKTFKLSFFKPINSLQLGLTDYICGMMMGETAELLARTYHITREEMDEYALMSHRRASAATTSGRFKAEIVPVPLPPQWNTFLETDNGIRHNQTLDALAKLPPVFDRKFGSVTAGNSSQITDGAAAMIVMSEKRAKQMGLKPLGRVKAFAFAGVDPAYMGIAPTYAIARVLQKENLKSRDIDLWEINEAFAAVVIANERLFADRQFVEATFGDAELLEPLDREKLNVNGGAIALGHPVGSSAARLVITLLKEMQRRDVQRGIAAMCIGGGQGGAVLVERL